MMIKKKTLDWTQQDIKDKYTHVGAYVWHEVMLMVQECGVGVTITPSMTGSKIKGISAQVSFGGASEIKMTNESNATNMEWFDVNGDGYKIGQSQASSSNRVSASSSSIQYVMVIGGKVGCYVFLSSTPISLQSDFMFMISKTTVDDVTETTVNGLHSKVNSLVGTLSSGVMKVTFVAPNIVSFTTNTRVLIKCLDGLGATGTGGSTIELSGSMIAEYFGTVVSDVHWILIPPKGMAILPYTIVNIDGVGYIVRGVASGESYYVWKVG